MKGRKRLVGALCVVLVLLLSIPIAGHAETKHLKLGMIMPLTGPLSIIGVGLSRTFELYLDKVNEGGGVKIGGDTYMLEMIAEDSKLDPSVAAVAAKKLIYRDGAKFVFGAIHPICAGAIYEVCAKAKAVHFITWLDAPGPPSDVSPEKPYAVRPSISSDAGWEMDYDFVRENYPSVKQVFVTLPEVGLDVERLKAVAKERGITVVAHELWPHGTVDFLPYYTKGLATKPDAIHAVCSAQAGYQLRAARQLGFKGVFFSDAPTAPGMIRDHAGAEACYDVFANGMDLDSPTEGMKEAIDRWAAKYKEPFVADFLMAWMWAEVPIQVFGKAQSTEPEKVVAAFDSMTTPGSIETCFGPGHMGGAKRFGVNRVLVRPMPITRLKNGQIELIGFRMPVVDG